MFSRFFLQLGFLSLLLATGTPVLSSDQRPNFVILFADDQGYQDMGCFGATKFRTPNLDRMSTEGLRMTSFYSAASVCTPSRAALLTGCYPDRVGKFPVLFPRSKIGINPDETTLAELLKSAGYRTACVGKWHLGHHHPFLPLQNGFDEYFGIPYSNDMGIDPNMKIAKNVKWRNGKTVEDFRGQTKGKLPPLMQGNEVIEWPADQTTLTRRYKDQGVRFIQESAKRQKPFFLYLPFTMPHIPLYVTEKFRGRSNGGLYGDAIEEIDSAVGDILQTLRDTGLEKNTVVVYTSDNGPWKLKGNATDKVKGNRNRRVGGSALPLRGHKFSHWEGGVRVPTIFWGPGRVLSGHVSDEMAGTIDLLPTFAAMASVDLPLQKIDGKNITALLTQPRTRSPHQAFFYRTEGVRDRRWKLKGKELFDLQSDISESRNVAAENPEVVKRLRTLLEQHKKDLKQNFRAPGKVAPAESATPKRN